MRRDEFVYSLPPDLIAQYPTEHRGDSRLLYLDGMTGRVKDWNFSSLPELLSAGDLLVLNNTRVIPARIYAEKETGGKVEILVERFVDEKRITVQLKASKAPKPGTFICLDDEIRLVVESRQNEMYVLKSDDDLDVAKVIQKYGHIPLPPYIQREDNEFDIERYQTVFAQHPGAVAAPTAGLHFTDSMFKRLKENGIEISCVTLHIGAGTFQPVRTEFIEQHTMHSEYLEVSRKTCEQITSVKNNNGKIIAVGTTAVRALETAALSGDLQPYQGETDIFIYPGFKFQVVDSLITNFHLPESTLLMLVCAFAGKENIFAAYRHAITNKYRFYSYGDAMFMTANKNN